MADFAALQVQIDALTAQVADSETKEASAVALIEGFQAAVTKAVTNALTADNSADQTSIEAATSAISGVAERFKASAGKLGDAVAANTPATPEPTV